MKKMTDIKDELVDIIEEHGGEISFDDFYSACLAKDIYSRGNTDFASIMTAARQGRLPIVYKNGVYKSWPKN